jgi:hypothetical protein
MTLRMPQGVASSSRRETGANVLDTEIAQLKAESLGSIGTQVEKALARLKAFDAQPTTDPAARGVLLDEAADKVWAFMIQRELCGLRHWDAVVKAYGIPREVLNRMGRVKTG